MPASELIVYGRDECGLCQRFKADCEQAGLAYRFVDLDSEDGGSEMWAKCCAQGITGSIGLPVVDVYGKMVVRPSIQEVKSRGFGNPHACVQPVMPQPTVNNKPAKAADSVTIQIPQGASPGDEINVNVNGAKFTVGVPVGAKPGDNLTVSIPAKSAKPAKKATSSEDMEAMMERDLARVKAEVASKGISVTGVEVTRSTKGNTTTTTKVFTMSDGSTRTETTTTTSTCQ